MAEGEQRHNLEIQNKTSSVLEVMVEVYPDRYLLQPDDKMVISADLGGAPFTVIAFDGGMQIYPGYDAGCPVTINGVPVQPDWESKV
jgi:hypothetical protein